MIIISSIMVRLRHLPGVWLLRRQIAGLCTVMIITAGRKEGCPGVLVCGSLSPFPVRKQKELSERLVFPASWVPPLRI